MSDVEALTMCCNCNDLELPVSEATTIDGEDYCETCRDENTSVCEECDSRVHDNEITHIQDSFLCDSCYDNLTVSCTHCSTTVLTASASTDEDGNEYCSSCADEYLTGCGRCEDTCHREDMIYTLQDEYVCKSCRDAHFTTCSSCGDIDRTSNMYVRNSGTYCEGCEGEHMDEDNGSAVSDYDYKPDPNFHGSDNGLFMGLEVEMDIGDGDSSDANTLMDIMNEYRHSHIYIKEDASLSEGFEVVSHPATLKYHTDDMAWKEMLQRAVNMGYRSHNTGTCGLHVHISRSFFGNSPVNQDVGIMKLLYLVERFWDKVLKFSRRSEEKARQWAGRYGLHLDEQSDPQLLLDRAKSDSARYRAVNLLNDSTIEIRIFRGSLRYETLIATLQFCHLLSTLSNTLELQEVVNFRWGDFVEKASIHEELTAYLKLRGLYTLEEVAVDTTMEV